MIKSFKDKEAEAIFNGKRSRRLPEEIQTAARRKLLMSDAAAVPLSATGGAFFFLPLNSYVTIT